MLKQGFDLVNKDVWLFAHRASGLTLASVLAFAHPNHRYKVMCAHHLGVPPYSAHQILREDGWLDKVYNNLHYIEKPTQIVFIDDYISGGNTVIMFHVILNKLWPEARKFHCVISVNPGLTLVNEKNLFVLEK